MESLPTIDFNVPIAFVQHYYISGLAALIFNIFVIYFILYHSKTIDKFKYYLLSFQLMCILVDVNITFLLQPIPLFPIVAGYFNGVFSTFLNLSSNFNMMYLTFSMASQLEVLTLCFIQKYKSVMQLPGGTEYPNWAYYCTYLVLTVIPIAMPACLLLGNESRETQMQSIRERYPAYASGFETLREFQHYRMNTALFFFFVFCFMGVAKGMAIVGFVVLQMFTVLKKLTSKVSSRTLAKHRTALFSLMAQYMITPVLMIPAAIMAAVVLIPVENAQAICQTCLTITTSHSTINAIVMIFTYPEFRKVVTFWKKPAKKASAVVSRL